MHKASILIPFPLARIMNVRVERNRDLDDANFLNVRPVNDEVRTLSRWKKLRRDSANGIIMICAKVGQDLNIFKVFKQRENVGQNRIMPSCVSPLFQHGFTEIENVMEGLVVLAERTFGVVG